MSFFKKLIGWGILLFIIIYGSIVFIKWIGIQVRRSGLKSKIEEVNEFFAAGTWTQEKVWKELTGYIDEKNLDVDPEEMVVKRTSTDAIIQVTLYDSLVLPKKIIYFEYELADTQEIK